MGIGAPAMAFCTVLAFAVGGQAQVIGAALPAGAVQLLAALLGEAHPGPLRVSGPGQGRTGRHSSGRIHRLEAADGTWMIVSADGDAGFGPNGYFAESIEGWRGGRPMLAADDFRLSLKEPELIQASAEAISWSGQHAGLTGTGIADYGRIRLEGDALALVASTISGSASLRGSPARRVLEWRVGHLSYSEGQIRAEAVSAVIGLELSVGAAGFDASLRRAGPWVVRIEDLLLSPALAGRILSEGGLSLPPADLRLTGRPDAAGAGRNGFSVEITWPGAGIRAEGVLSDSGDVSLSGVEADGLLAMLSSAGAADPLAAAALFGLHHNPANQDADRLRLPAGSGRRTD